MRKAVLTGLLACVLTLMAGTAKAEAAPIDFLKTNNDEIANLEVLDSSSDLIEIVSKDPEPEINIDVKHVVSDSETLTDIAQVYETTWQRIYDKNEQLENPDVINPGLELVIPAPEEVVEPRILPEEEIVEAVEVAPVRTTKVSTKTSIKASTVTYASTAGNTYSAGYCTWYVKNRRPDLPNGLGNANTWASRASARGLATGSTPRVGAAAQLRVRNHVAYVESINGDGTINISEMNFNGGLFKINYRTVPASDFVYIY